MNQSGDSSAKTEQPTAVKLREARRNGNVLKSKELTSTLVLAGLFTVLWLTFYSNTKTLFELTNNILSFQESSFQAALQTIGMQALDAFISITGTFIIPVVLFGLIVEFIQTGPLFTLRKVFPRLSNLTSINTFNRMFNISSLLVVLLSTMKAVVVLCIAYLVIRSFMKELTLLPNTTPGDIAIVLKEMFNTFMLWTLSIFALFMLLDWSYQRYAFMKSMRMSVNEVRDEQKRMSANPSLKRERRRFLNSAGHDS